MLTQSGLDPQSALSLRRLLSSCYSPGWSPALPLHRGSLGLSPPRLPSPSLAGSLDSP